jgi:hypothetical protein
MICAEWSVCRHSRTSRKVLGLQKSGNSLRDETSLSYLLFESGQTLCEYLSDHSRFCPQAKMKLSLLASALLAISSTSATYLELYTSAGCTGDYDRDVVLVEGDCLNRLTSFWLSYKVIERATKEPQQYLRTWRKKNCVQGNGSGKEQSCHHIGPDGGLTDGTCIDTVGFRSIGQTATKCL